MTQHFHHPDHPDSSSQHFAGSPAENYQRFFVPAIAKPVAEDLVRVAALHEGERVLDVGCGTGVVSRLAAEKVGRRKVVGLDPNPAMLAVARKITPEEMEIEWYEAGAEKMPLPDGAFDVVLCQMALQFVPDKAGALAEMRRVLAPKGRLALNLPGPAAPPFAAMAEAMGRHIRPEASGFMRAVFALHDQSAIEKLLEEAGFEGARATAKLKELHLPAPREFLWQYVSGTPLAEIVGAADAGARVALEEDLVAKWAELADGDGMKIEQRVVTGTAHL